MKKIITSLAVAGSLYFTQLSYAQVTDVTVDIAKANMSWSWSQGEGGAVEKWLIKCGPTAGSYTSTVQLAVPAARSIPLTQVVSTVGEYFCVVAATNTFGPSANSNEVRFIAGKAPNAAIDFTISAQ